MVALGDAAEQPRLLEVAGDDLAAGEELLDVEGVVEAPFVGNGWFVCIIE
jgi:hypothetical protein